MKKVVSVIILTMLLTSMLPLVFNVRPVEAWGKSGKVAVIDDFYGSAVGYLYPSDYPDYTFTALSASQVSAEALANYDTVIMFMFNPSGLTAAQKAAINDWIYKGGKLIIWDSDQVPPGSPWDYTWLPYPFTTSVPGQTGQTGKGLNVLEENQLSSSDPSSPYYIDTAVLNSQTDAVGDANVLISYSPGWRIDMMATNVLGETGPAHVYAAYGSGLIIYSALDWNYAGYNVATGAWLKKILKQELECSYLPFVAPTVPEEVGLIVEVTSDKEFYNVSETINFEVTVSNPTNETGINLVAENVGLTVVEPEEVEIYQLGGISVADIGPGESDSTTFYGKARKAGINVVITVNALGWTRLGPIGGRDFCVISIYDKAAPPQPDWSYAVITDIHIGYNSPRWDSDNDDYAEIDYAGAGWDDFLQHTEREDYSVTKNLEYAVDKIITEKGPYKTKFVVVLGDISDTAEKSEFMKAREILNRLNDPNGDGNTDDGIPYIPLFGNHDPWPYAQDTLSADDRYRYSFIASNATGDKFFKDIFWGESNGNNKKLIENLFGNSWEYTYDKPVNMTANGKWKGGKWKGEACGYKFLPCVEELSEGINYYYDKDNKEPTIFECDYYLQNYGFTYDGITFVCLDLIPRLDADLDLQDGVALPGVPVRGGIATDHPETLKFSKDYILRHNPTQTKKIVFFSHYPIGPSVLNYMPSISFVGYDVYCFFGHYHLTGDYSVSEIDVAALPFPHLLSYTYHGILTEDVADILPEWLQIIERPIVKWMIEKMGFKRTRETVRVVQIKNGEINYSTTLKPKSVEILWPFPDFAYPYASYPEPNKEITFTARFTSYHGFKTSFNWDFGDGSYASGSSVTHSYSQDGIYNVTLTVTTKNLVTGEEKTYTATHHIYVHSKHVISPLPSDLNATSSLTGEDLTKVPKNTYQPTLITKSTSEEIPIAELGVHFEEATEDIDLSALMADVDLEEAKSVIYMSSWPEEIEEYKVLFIPSTGTGTVYICSNAMSLDEVNLENADIVIKVGETKDGITVTTTFCNGREYYLVSGITGTGGGEVKDTIPPTTTLTIGEPKYVTEITYVTHDTPFNLTATDNPGGTGVALTAYKIRNATYDSGWLTYTETFYLTGLADGVYTIDYNSTDNANNVEPTNTINVTLFSWNYVFTDSYGRETTLKINTEHHFFQFITPDKDYGIRKATYMRLCGRAIIIKHYDNELRLITVAVDTKLDLCYAIAWDLQTGKRYSLIDKAGTE
jgi:hypothetical protein